MECSSNYLEKRNSENNRITAPMKIKSKDEG